MIQDFWRFLRHCAEVIHFIRGVLVMLLLLLVICTLIFVFAEGLSLGAAAYLTLITALTIGYGDVTPVTGVGQAASVVAGLVGVVFVGIVVAVANRALAQGVEEKQRKRGARRES